MSQDGTAVMLEVTGVCRVLHAVAIVETFERSQLLIRPVLGRAWREQRSVRALLTCGNAS